MRLIARIKGDSLVLQAEPLDVRILADLLQLRFFVDDQVLNLGRVEHEFGLDFLHLDWLIDL